MSDIDQIIAGGAKTNADFDFGKLNRSYWEGKDQAAKNDLRDVFKGGLPMKGDQVDWPAVTQKFFSIGAIDQGVSAAGQSLAQQKMEYGQRIGERAFPTGQPIDGNPPSANRSASAVVAPPLNKGGVQAQGGGRPQGGSPQGDQPGSIVGLVSAAGIPDELAGPVIQQVSALAKTDPNATLNPEVLQRIQQVVQAAAQRMKGGQQPQPTGLAPQSAPPQMAQAPQQAPQQQPDFNQRFSAARPGGDPTLGGLVPVGRTAQQQIDGLTNAIGSNMLTPEVAKTYQARIDAITKAIEPTNPMKEYEKALQQGFKGSLEDWQNRDADNTTQRDILTKSLIPRLEKSQEKASAARDDIDVIHRARTELDRPGGIFSGAVAGKKLDLAKAAELFGISNSDKIANTETFKAAAGQRVASLIKAFGSGTAISDGDRRFTQDIAAGSIELDEKSIRRLFDIGEQANRLIIERHNSLVDKNVRSNEGLKASRDTYIVEPSGAYKKASAPDPYTKAREAIAAGAPRDAVAARLKQSGFDPGKL